MLLPFVGRPYYNGFGAHYLAEKATWWGQSETPLSLITGQRVSSLLPDAFNSLLCDAFNLDDNGKKATHFLMQHGDIVPQQNWISIMLDEMESHQLDVLSAVSPIKTVDMDDTSTAVGVVDGKNTRFRRLMVAETMDLPETFFLEDTNHEPDDKLLVNTGLLCIDLRKPWVKEWMLTGGFRFETYIMQKEDGEWHSVCLPEDWLFSWDAQTKFGAKVAATTKVRLIHYGEVGFANRHPREDSQPNAE